MIRLAGFRRLDPVVPDRTTFGAAAQRDAERERANHDCPSPQHDPNYSPDPSYGPGPGIFKPTAGSFPRCGVIVILAANHGYRLITTVARTARLSARAIFSDVPADARSILVNQP